LIGWKRVVGPNEAPAGPDWLHEIKYDGYRMHARLVEAQLLTRTGLDLSKQYRFTIGALPYALRRRVASAFAPIVDAITEPPLHRNTAPNRA
jgi:hypothetical protein